MHRVILANLGFFTLALSGCQTGEPIGYYGTRNDPRFENFCHDRPVEAGICHQKSNFRLFASADADR